MGSKEAFHEIMQDLLRVREELGRFPTRSQYLKHGKFSQNDICKNYGSWMLFVQAAGLQYSIKGKRDQEEIREEAYNKLQEEIFEKKKQNNRLVTSKLMVLSDLHAPVNHPDAIEFIIQLKRKFNPDLVCSVGDEVDLAAFSYHEKEPMMPSAGYELEQAIKILQPLYKEIPVMYLAESNHGSLVYRKAKTAGLPNRVIKSYREILSAPVGWEWRFEIQVEFPNGSKCVIHHSYGANALLAAQRRGVSTITGHHHTQQAISFWKNLDHTHFAAVIGCFVDETSMAMSYSKNNVGRPLLGCLVVDEGNPKLVRMNLDKFGRWDGKILL